MNELSILKIIIKKAGAKILHYYQREINIEYKESDHTPVTQADRVSQDILIAGLSSLGYAFLSEEYADDGKRLQSQRVWIIDPLDGTSDFLKRTGEFSVMVGLVENGRPILAAIYQPVADILYYARKGEGAYREQGSAPPQRLHVSLKSDMRTLGMLVSRNYLLPMEVEVARQLGINKVIPCGSVGVKVGLIAAGMADLLINSSDKTGEWDSCAADCIIQEAGGMMTDMHGRSLGYNKKDPKNFDGFVVSNGKIHQRVIAAIQKVFSVSALTESS